MNYFKDHIGDYAAATSHLSWDEDMAYTRLIRAYYLSEKPIPVNMAAACRMARATSKAQKEAVKTVLDEFFILQDDGWHQKRCDEEIDHFQGKRKKAAASADSRWERERLQNEGNANAMQGDMRTHSEGNANHKPLTTNQEPITKEKRGRFTPPALKEVEEYCLERKNSINPQTFLDFYQANGWVQGKGKPVKDWRACVRTWEAREKDSPQKKGNGTIPSPNDHRALEVYASDHGITSKPGESYFDLRQRCVAANT
jgi:uncharacterized protein YdaU (DUF1376 family)